MFRFFVLLFLFTLAACSPNEAPETIELESLLPQSNYEPKEIETIEEEVEHSPILVFFEPYFPTWNVVDSNLNTSLFPDRFSFEQRTHHFITKENQSIELFHWTFKDSITTLSTFFNWLDCLGEDCMSVRTFEDTAIQEQPLFSIWVGEQQLIHLKGNARISIEKWSQIMDSTFSDENWLYRMHQYPRKKIEWLPKEVYEIDSLSPLSIESK